MDTADSVMLQAHFQEMSHQKGFSLLWPLFRTPITWYLHSANIQTLLNALENATAIRSHSQSTRIKRFSCQPALRCHSPKWPGDGSTDRQRQGIAHYGLGRKVPFPFSVRCDDGHTLHCPKKIGRHDVVTIPFHSPLSSFRELRVPSSCSTVTCRSPELFH